jgi:hypothetical protein
MKLINFFLVKKIGNYVKRQDFSNKLKITNIISAVTKLRENLDFYKMIEMQTYCTCCVQCS